MDFSDAKTGCCIAIRSKKSWCWVARCRVEKVSVRRCIAVQDQFATVRDADVLNAGVVVARELVNFSRGRSTAS